MMLAVLLGAPSLAILLAPAAPRVAHPTMVIEGSGSEKLRSKLSAAAKHKIPLPAALKVMGCDDALWSKIRAKDAFVRLLDAGDEAGAKARLDQVRNAPSVTGAGWAMPAVIGEWGCDEEMWGKIRSKRAILELARNGDEAEGRRRIERMREIITQEADAPAEPSATAAATKARKPSSNSGTRKKAATKAKPLSDGYTLDGEAPSGADVEAIEKLLSARVAAKLAKDYATADGLQAELEGLGVFCNDRLRTWSAERPSKQ